MKPELYIYGASYPDIIKILNTIYKDDVYKKKIGFIDDIKHLKESNFLDYPIIGNQSILTSLSKSASIINNVHSSSNARMTVDQKILEAGFRPLSIISPSTNLDFVSVGQGVFIHEGVLLGANVTINDGASIKIGATLSHDTLIGDYAFIGPCSLLCGHVTVGNRAYIGANSVVKEHTNIGEGSIVGAGSVVINDVEPWSVVVGNPARVIRRISNA